MSPELDWVSSIALGALQGVAEFLPISSSGHLSLAQAWLGIDPASAGHTFNVVVHAGTLLAVLWVYREDLRQLLFAYRSTPDGESARRTLRSLFIGCLPLVVALYPPVKSAIISMEGNVQAIGCALIGTAALLTFSHRKDCPQDDVFAPPTDRQSFLIGCAQLLAIMPGVSRSGMTIAAALALGLGRIRAARYSFLLSIPAVSAATLLELKDALEAGDADTALLSYFAAGFAASFTVGLLALRGLLRFIGRAGLLPFVPYLLLVGLAALLLG